MNYYKNRIIGISIAVISIIGLLSTLLIVDVLPRLDRPATEEGIDSVAEHVFDKEDFTFTLSEEGILNMQYLTGESINIDMEVVSPGITEIGEETYFAFWNFSELPTIMPPVVCTNLIVETTNLEDFEDATDAISGVECPVV